MTESTAARWTKPTWSRQCDSGRMPPAPAAANTASCRMNVVVTLSSAVSLTGRSADVATAGTAHRPRGIHSADDARRQTESRQYSPRRRELISVCAIISIKTSTIIRVVHERTIARGSSREELFDYLATRKSVNNHGNEAITSAGTAPSVVLHLLDLPTATCNTNTTVLLKQNSQRWVRKELASGADKFHLAKNQGRGAVALVGDDLIGKSFKSSHSIPSIHA